MYRKVNIFKLINIYFTWKLIFLPKIRLNTGKLKTKSTTKCYLPEHCYFTNYLIFAFVIKFKLFWKLRMQIVIFFKLQFFIIVKVRTYDPVVQGTHWTGKSMLDCIIQPSVNKINTYPKAIFFSWYSDFKNWIIFCRYVL